LAEALQQVGVAEVAGAIRFGKPAEVAEDASEGR
jgi:hypothetical protein